MNLFSNNMLLMMTTQVKCDWDALIIISSFRMTAANDLVSIRQIHFIRGLFPVMLQNVQQNASNISIHLCASKFKMYYMKRPK